MAFPSSSPAAPADLPTLIRPPDAAVIRPVSGWGKPFNCPGFGYRGRRSAKNPAPTECYLFGDVQPLPGTSVTEVNGVKTISFSKEAMASLSAGVESAPGVLSSPVEVAVKMAEVPSVKLPDVLPDHLVLHPEVLKCPDPADASLTHVPSSGPSSSTASSNSVDVPPNSVVVPANHGTQLHPEALVWPCEVQSKVSHGPATPVVSPAAGDSSTFLVAKPTFLDVAQSGNPSKIQRSSSFIFGQTQPFPGVSCKSSDGGEVLVFDDETTNLLAAPFKWALIGKFSHQIPTAIFTSKFFSVLGLTGDVELKWLNKRQVLIILSNECDFVNVWVKRFFRIDNCPMRVFKWSPTYNLKQECSIVPVWVSLPELPVHLFEIRSLFSIASQLGIPLKVDVATACKTRFSFARICVGLDLLKPFKNSVSLNINGVIMVIPVVFEKVPAYCAFCSHVGHGPLECLAKPIDGAVVSNSSKAAAEVSPQLGSDGFVLDGCVDGGDVGLINGGNVGEDKVVRPVVNRRPKNKNKRRNKWEWVKVSEMDSPAAVPVVFSSGSPPVAPMIPKNVKKKKTRKVRKRAEKRKFQISGTLPSFSGELLSGRDSQTNGVFGEEHDVSIEGLPAVEQGLVGIGQPTTVSLSPAVVSSLVVGDLVVSSQALSLPAVENSLGSIKSVGNDVALIGKDVNAWDSLSADGDTVSLNFVPPSFHALSFKDVAADNYGLVGGELNAEDSLSVICWEDGPLCMDDCVVKATAVAALNVGHGLNSNLGAFSNVEPDANKELILYGPAGPETASINNGAGSKRLLNAQARPFGPSGPLAGYKEHISIRDDGNLIVRSDFISGPTQNGPLAKIPPYKKKKEKFVSGLIDGNVSDDPADITWWSNKNMLDLKIGPANSDGSSQRDDKLANFLSAKYNSNEIQSCPFVDAIPLQTLYSANSEYGHSELYDNSSWGSDFGEGDDFDGTQICYDGIL